MFEECLYEKEYGRLVVEGEFSEEEVASAWRKIYLEYVALSSEGQYDAVYDKTLEINTYVAKIFWVNKAVDHLYDFYDEDLGEKIRFWGLPCSLIAEDDREARIKKLKLTIATAKKWAVRLDVLQAEYKALQTDQSINEDGHYIIEENLRNISNWRKYPVVSSAITVKQYCSHLKDMRKENDRLQMELNRK